MDDKQSAKNSPSALAVSDLPILRYREEILTRIRKHPVVVICGETGSGKSTQIPQLLMSAGYCEPSSGRISRIAHTQPRRVAAISLAKRIGEETIANHPTWAGTTPVGYKIRFEDKVAPDTKIKLMTDGMLIAETAHDRDLQQYTAIIIDEAHERSLNIDFLLGYLKSLIKRRSDLRVVITSATIDAERFSTFYGNAPVINVEGRSFPVSIRYRPLEGDSALPTALENEDKERLEQREAWREDKWEERLPKAVAESALDLWNDPQEGGPGDILVFLPGEGEIRALMDYLPGFLARTRFSHTEVLPLMSRLSSQEQMKIFHPSDSHLRIILATNIAETSLTVPRIRYVIDSGLSRVLRYSPRMKINRLEVEPIAQDSAKQRAGRCGRISAGICIRLYDEENFQARPLQTTPEILRSSLSLVILRLLSLQWGDVREFPWIDPPSSRMIHHGLTELNDLGAINAEGVLTPLGEHMSKIPIDHTLSRMLIEADRKKVLAETLIIVSALSTREVRELPLDAEDRARQAHRIFDDERSDFVTIINIWTRVEAARHEAESNRAFRQWCQRHFLSWVRLREWRELHLQLQAQLRRIFPHYHAPNATIEPGKTIDEPTLKSIHQSILCGLPTQIGRKHDTENYYQGPRGLKFFADRRWVNRKARWILCGEMIATPRPIGRRIGKIDSALILEALPHLVDIKWLEPFWDKGQQAVMIHRQISLQGLMIEPRQRVSHQPQSDEEWATAQAVFIRGAWMEAEIQLPPPWDKLLIHNQNALDSLIEQENRVRRPGSLVDDAGVFAFYRHALDLIAPRVINGRDFLKSLKAYRTKNPNDNPLLIDVETWKQRASIGQEEDFPGVWVAGELRLPIRYTFAPGSDDDGMTITLDETLLPVFPRHLCDWLVPGMRLEKVESAIKTLPKRLRFALKDVAPRFVKEVSASNTPLLAQLAQYCSHTLRQSVPLSLFREENIPLHLKMRIRVINEHGATILDTRNPAQLDAYLEGRPTTRRSSTTSAINLSPNSNNIPLISTTTIENPVGIPSEPISTWTEALGDLPRKVPMTIAGQSINGWLTLIYEHNEVFVRAFADEVESKRHFSEALLELASRLLSAQIKAFRAPNILRLQLPQSWFIDDNALKHAVLRSSLSQLMLADPIPCNAKSFELRVKEIKSRFLLIAETHCSLLQQMAGLFKSAQALIQKTHDRALKDDCAQTLTSLFPQNFFQNTPSEFLRHLPRFTQAIINRLEKFPKNPARDQKNSADINALLRRISKLTSDYRLSHSQAENFHWLLHELRVGLFAQELKTSLPISVKRVEKMLDEVS